MKKCPNCKNVFSDQITRCPECSLFLITDIVSDFEIPNQNRRIHVRSVDSSHNSVFSSGNANQYFRGSSVRNRGTDLHRSGDTSESFKPGKNTNDRPNVHMGDSDRGRYRMSWFHRILRVLLPILRIVMPVLLIGIAVLLIVINWGSIRPILTCLLLGAIIGGTLLTYLSVRYGHHFNSNVMTTGAIIGAFLACVLQYNLLDLGTGLESFLNALGPVMLILLGIWMMIRSIMR